MQWCCTKNVIHVQYNTGWKTLQWPLHHTGHARSVRPTGQAQQQMVGHRPNKTKPGFHRPRIRLHLASTTGHSKQCSLCTNWPLVFSRSLSLTHTHTTYARALTSKYSFTSRTEKKTPLQEEDLFQLACWPLDGSNLSLYIYLYCLLLF